MNDSTRRFSSRVDDYIKYRPTYPAAVVDLLQQQCGLTSDWTIADVGSGPGHLTRLFLDNGNRVVGVEPNREMREAGEKLLRGYPRFVSVDGTAEATTLGDDSADLVVAGQAFHWFDQVRAREEFKRILRSPHRVALVWNARQITSTPFLVAYEALLLRYGTDYAQVRHRDGANTAAIESFFAKEEYRRATFPNEQVFDFDGVRGRLLSSSYAPESGQLGHEAMLADLRTLFDEHQSGGKVSFTYDTEVYYGGI